MDPLAISFFVVSALLGFLFFGAYAGALGLPGIVAIVVATIPFFVYAISRFYRQAPDLRIESDQAKVGVTGIRRGLRQAKQSQHSVFLSYRRDDAADITGRLYDKLTAALGKQRVFKDIDSIPLGSDFRQHIDESLAQCKVFLLVIGQRWQGPTGPQGQSRIDDPRDFVRLEVEAALRRNIPVIPILVHGAAIPSEGSLPEQMRGIAYRQAIHLRSDPDFHRDVDRIVGFLQTI